jgi:hypothetical protein
MSAAKHTLLLSDTGGTCDQCHDLSTLKFFGVTNLTTRPNGHHVGKDCNGCHSPNNWGGGGGKKPPAAPAPAHSTIATVIAATARVQSTALQSAAGVVGATSPITGLGAAGPRLSHAGVTGACASCHNGVLAPGKAPTHIASNTACADCHTTFAWIPARFEHRAPMSRCISCHNGAAAPGKPTAHIQTSQDCGSCHGTIAWSPATFSHLGVTASCVSCHNGTTALGKPVQHAVTARDCSTCHNTLSWTVSTPAPRLRPLLQRQRGAATGQPK